MTGTLIAVIICFFCFRSRQFNSKDENERQALSKEGGIPVSNDLPFCMIPMTSG